MSVRKAAHQHSICGLVELGPPVAERMALQAEADSEPVACYVLTRAAEHAWEAISLQEQSAEGAVFWIGGPPGTGKTHFLNYALALHRKAGPIRGERLRRITIALEFAGSHTIEDLESRLLDALAREIMGSRWPMLWRQMHGVDALTILLSEARRHGFGSLELAMDFGEAALDEAAEYIEVLAQVCRLKVPRLIVIAAGRGAAPPVADVFEVGPSDAMEELAAGIGRARRLLPGAEQLIEEFYGAASANAFDARMIFPFDGASIHTLRALANPDGRIAEIARLVRDVLAPRGDNRIAPYRRAIAMADLMTSAEVRARVERRLADAGRAALKIACETVEQTESDDRGLAGEIVPTLALAHFRDESPQLKVADILSLLPSRFDGSLDPAQALPRLSALLKALAEKSAGVIQFDGKAAYFNPRDRGASGVAAFNAALPLIRKFDSSITEAHEIPELNAKLKRLGDAMANALEAAHRTRQVLAPAINEVRDRLPDESNSALPDYSALAAAGPEALIQTSGDPERRERAMKTIQTYEQMAAAAAAAPRLWQMRDYVRATGLEFKAEESPAKEGRISELETQCQLLGSQLNPGVLLGGQRNIDALQARFQQFRWSYVQEYRIAHERWRAEMKKLRDVLIDARRHFDALRRLDAITALGPPEGRALEPVLAELETKVAVCEFDGPPSPEMNPRCPGCGFVLGTPSPASELDDLFARIEAAIGRRLEALSKTAIARLIREHDSSHKLDGFLKITQAAQTDALVRVLDDDLARYLAQLIDENLAPKPASPASAAHGPRKKD